MSNPIATLPRARTLTIVAAAATIVLWASAFVAIRVAARSFSGGPLALLRFSVASATLLAVLPLRRRAERAIQPDRAVRSSVTRRDLPWLALVGLTGVALYHAALNEGERTVAAGTASLLIASSPIFTALLSRGALGERLGARGALGIGIGFAGVARLAIGTGAGVSGLVPSRGAALVLFAAFIQAVFFVLQKPLLTRLSAFEVTVGSIFFGTAALALAFGGDLLRTLGTAPRQAILAAVYLGVLPGALANGLWTYVLSKVPATRAAAALFLVPPIALLMGWAVLGEKPGASAVIGGALAMAGVALVLGRGRRAGEPPPRMGTTSWIVTSHQERLRETRSTSVFDRS